MLEIELNSNAQDVVRKIERFSAEMLSAIGGAMDKENDLTVGYIQKEKLNFSKDSPPVPDGLRHITRTLQKSVRRNDAQVIGQAVSSAIGSNVIYAAAHEFGFQGTVQVPAHKRRIIAHDRYRQTRGGKFVKTQSGIKGIVRAHSMQMNIPARAPFGNSLAERTDNYSKSISTAIVDLWNGGES